MKDIRFTIISNKKIADRTYKAVLGCEKNTHGITRPGQFINIRLDGFFLRRPLSVCSSTEESLTIIYKVVGSGTEKLSSMGAGDELDILTPLGNGFDTSVSGNRPVLIGGGAGTPPMYGLCARLKEEGKEPMVVLGFGSAGEVFYIDEFRKLGVEPHITTADGSMGSKGFVTAPLKALDITYFYACGPEPMLKALDSEIDEAADGQMSFEERMGCGFGACMGCSIETAKGPKRVCKDGPVFLKEDLLW